MDNHVPGVLHGRESVPLEAETLIRQRGATDQGISDPNEACPEGVRIIAQELAEALSNERQRIADVGEGQDSAHCRDYRVDARTREWAYILSAYCRKFGIAPPDALLWLLFEALQLTEMQPSAAVRSELGMPDGVSDAYAFQEAARIEGEAAALTGSWPSINEMAQKVGVARDTIRRWRQSSQYGRIRDGIFQITKF